MQHSLQALRAEHSQGWRSRSLYHLSNSNSVRRDNTCCWTDRQEHCFWVAFLHTLRASTAKPLCLFKKKKIEKGACRTSDTPFCLQRLPTPLVLLSSVPSESHASTQLFLSPITLITIGESRFNLHTARAEDQAATLAQAKLDETTYWIKKQATKSMLKTNTFMMLPLCLLWGKRWC